MTVQQMKDAILHVYDTTSWKKKVENMHDNQIIAIYWKFYERGILGEVLRKEKPKVEEKQHRYQQLTLFDFLDEQNNKKEGNINE